MADQIVKGLYGMHIDEISIVPSGDNTGAHIVLAKADPNISKAKGNSGDPLKSDTKNVPDDADDVEGGGLDDEDNEDANDGNRSAPKEGAKVTDKGSNAPTGTNASTGSKNAGGGTNLKSFPGEGNDKGGKDVRKSDGFFQRLAKALVNGEQSPLPNDYDMDADDADVQNLPPGDETDAEGKKVKKADPASFEQVWFIKRDFTQEKRDALAAKGHALPDGSYPIETAEDLNNAATLAKSGHGNVAGAKKLIARRAKELGVKNPLNDDGDDDDTTMSKSQVPFQLASTLSTKTSTEDGMPDDIKKDDLDPAVRAYVEKLEGQVADLSKSAPAETEEVRLEKALEKADPVIRAEIMKAHQRATEAETIAKAEREARLEREYIAKAAKLPHVGESTEATATLLRKLNDLDPTVAAEVEKIWATQEKQIAKGALFDEIGAAGANTTISKSVEAMATELRKSHEGMTQEQAISRVLEQNPDLYDEMIREGK